jgi:AsmA protein
MKKAAVILLGVVVLVIGAALVVPFLIPTETYTRQLEAQVQRATGRNLKIEGPVQVSLLPRLAIEVTDVRFANAPGASEADMVRLRTLQAELRIWPLITGSVEVDRFVLVEPVIHLEIDAQGRPNWQFGEESATEAPPEATGPDAPPGGPTLPVTDLRLGDIRIENGSLTFFDATSGTREQLHGIAMSVRLPDIRSPFEAEGALRYKDQPVTLRLLVEEPLALAQDGTSRVRFNTVAPDTEASFDGRVRGGDAPGVEGALELRAGSLRELAAWLAEPIELEGEGLRTLSIAGHLAAGPQQVALTDARIHLDRIQAAGQLAVTLGAVPQASGRLDFGMVDLAPYLPPEAAEEPPSLAPTAPAPGTDAPPDWSDEPIALPPIGGFELDLDLTVTGLRTGDLEVGPSALTLALRDNRFTAELTEMTLYGGRGQGSLELALAGATPQIRHRFQLQGLQALPFLSAAADFERLEGTADLELAVETQGGSERQLVQNLQGSGRAAFTDGAIVGMNIAAMVRNVGAAFLDPAAGEARKTDFAELGGSFVIERGVLRNDDMRLQAPTLRVGGRGTVDLPARLINYRIEPRAVASLEGQGGRTDISGLLVPVVIEGPWHDISFRPDLSNLLQSAIENPEQIQRQLEQLGGQAEGLRDAIREADPAALVDQLQRSEQGQRLFEQVGQGEGRGLIDALGSALRRGEQPPADQPPPAEGEAAPESPPPPSAPQNPAEQLLRGLLGR